MYFIECKSTSERGLIPSCHFQQQMPGFNNICIDYYFFRFVCFFRWWIFCRAFVLHTQLRWNSYCAFSRISKGENCFFNMPLRLRIFICFLQWLEPRYLHGSWVDLGPMLSKSEGNFWSLPAIFLLNRVSLHNRIKLTDVLGVRFTNVANASSNPVLTVD